MSPELPRIAPEDKEIIGMVKKRNKFIRSIFKGIFYVFYLTLALEIILRAAGFLIFLPNRINRCFDMKKDKTFRILAIGESTTAGLYVLQGQAYPTQVELLLNMHFPQMNFIVINSGVPAQTSTSILRSINYQLDKYKPDLVISLFGPNDTNEALNGLNSRIIFGSVYLPEWVTKLKIYKLVSVGKDMMLYHPKFTENGILIYYNPYRKNADGTWRHNNYYLKQLFLNYKEIINIAHNHNVRFVILSYFRRSKEMDDIYSKLSKETHSLYIDLNIPSEKLNADLFTGDGFHPSVKGHRIMAEKIVEWLIKERLITTGSLEVAKSLK